MGRSTGRVLPTNEKRSDLTVTAGEVFPDSGMLEMVRDPSDPARPALLHWDGKHATVAPEIGVGGRHYVPPEIDPSLWRRLRLPSGFAPYGSTTELFDRIRSLITKYSGLSDEYSRLLTYSTFASHFVDCLQTAPCVVLHGCADIATIGLALPTPCAPHRCWSERARVLKADTPDLSAPHKSGKALGSSATVRFRYFPPRVVA